MAATKHALKPEAVCGYQPISHTPKFVTIKKTNDDRNDPKRTVVVFFDFLKPRPKMLISTIEPHVKAMVLWKPKKMSLMIMRAKGTIKASLRLGKVTAANKAMAATGLTLGM